MRTSGFRIKTHNVEFVRNDGFWLFATQPRRRESRERLDAGLKPPRKRSGARHVGVGYSLAGLKK